MLPADGSQIRSPSTLGIYAALVNVCSQKMNSYIWGQTRFLGVCPRFYHHFFSRRPQVIDSVGATTILTRGRPRKVLGDWREIESDPIFCTEFKR